MCKNCGFHESYRTKSSKKPKTLRELLNQTYNLSNRVRKISVISKKSLCMITGTNNVNTKSNFNEIAGLVSPLVGSSTDCSLLKIAFSSNKENKTDYLCLDECKSGMDDTKIDADAKFNSSSLNDLSLFEDHLHNKINYVPLEIVNSRNDIDIVIESTSQLSDSSSLNNNDNKIYDLDLNNSFTFSKQSNISNTTTQTNSDIPYSYLDAKRTEALKSTIKEHKKQF